MSWLKSGLVVGLPPALPSGRLAVDGREGEVELPSYVPDDQKDDLLMKLRAKAFEKSDSKSKRMLDDSELQAFREIFTLQLLGILVHPMNNEFSMKRFSTPMPGTPEWKDVEFRLTVAWRGVEESDKEIKLVLDHFELGGRTVLHPHAETGLTGSLLFGCTVFLGTEKSNQSVLPSGPTPPPPVGSMTGRVNERTDIRSKESCEISPESKLVLRHEPGGCLGDPSACDRRNQV